MPKNILLHMQYYFSLKQSFLLLLFPLLLSSLIAQENSSLCPIDMQDFVLTISCNQSLPKDATGKNTTADTVFIQFPFETKSNPIAFGVQFKNGIQNFQVEEQYQTSMSVTEEGAHLDLIEWEYFLSNKSLLSISSGQFYSDSLTSQQQKQFPEVSTQQIVNRVLQKIGTSDNKFYQQAMGCQSATSRPCTVSVSRKIFTFTYSNVAGKKERQVLVVLLPLGC